VKFLDSVQGFFLKINKKPYTLLGQAYESRVVRTAKKFNFIRVLFFMINFLLFTNGAKRRSPNPILLTYPMVLLEGFKIRIKNSLTNFSLLKGK